MTRKSQSTRTAPVPGPAILLASVLLVCSLVLLGDRLPAGGGGDEEMSRFQAIEAQAQLIPAPTAELPWGVERMLAWPSAETLDQRQTLDDRSEQLAPTLPEGGPPDAKPIVFGGISPQAALEEAEVWIRTVLKEEWIPSDLAERLIPQQAEQPEWSSVICRYSVGGTAIQISQTRWAITLVIQEDAAQEVAASDGGPRVFERFFTEGERMADLPFAPPSAIAGALYILDERSLESPEAFENWWGSASWYAEGDATAVVMRKRIEGEMHTPRPDEPWF